MATPTLSGSEFLVNTTTGFNQDNPTIAALADGRFVVTWTDESGTAGDTSLDAIRAQIFTADGVASGAEFLVNSTTSGNQSIPVITGLASGGFVISWQDGSSTGGDISGNAIRAQIYTAAGVELGAELLINTATLSDQSTPSITGLATGGFVVTWADLSGVGGDASNFAIHAQVFNANGTLSGSEFLVNTTTTSLQFQPTVTDLAGGGFVITWSDLSQTGSDTSSSAIRAQIYNANGTTLGGEFLVNSTTSSNQSAAAITGLTNGKFVISWEDFSQSSGDTSSNAIRAQIFDADGSKSGSEFLVNTTTLGSQITSDITSLHDGRFVITWRDGSTSGGDTSNASVRAQVFNADGTKSGSEFLVNTTTAGAQSEPTITELADGRIVIAWTDSSLSGGDTSNNAVRAQIFDPNDAPTVTGAPSDVDVTEDTASNVDLSAMSFDDANGDDLTVTLAASAGLLAAASSGGVTVTGSGTSELTLSGTAAAINTYLDTISNVKYTGASNVNGDNAATLTVSASDGHRGSLASDPVINLDITAENDAPVGLPEVSGIATTGEMLSADLLGVSDADGIDVGTVSWQWLSDGVDIFGATADSYDLTKDDTGSVISVRLTYTDDDGTVENLTSAATITIRFGDEIITGGEFDDVLRGHDGNDIIQGLGGNDHIIGGRGDDILRGGAGNDTLRGWTGADQLFGKAGDDFLIGGDGADTLRGGIGQDILKGREGDDLLFGGVGDDELYGGAGDDMLSGGTGGDLLRGRGGRDLLFGGEGNDRMFGGAGDDILNGGSDSDKMYGGDGHDIFIFSNGNDVIGDFDTASDREKIDLSYVSSITGFNDLKANHVSEADGNTTIDDLAGNTLTLEGVLIDDLSKGDFIF